MAKSECTQGNKDMSVETNLQERIEKCSTQLKEAFGRDIDQQAKMLWAIFCESLNDYEGEDEEDSLSIKSEMSAECSCDEKDDLYEEIKSEPDDDIIEIEENEEPKNKKKTRGKTASNCGGAPKSKKAKTSGGKAQKKKKCYAIVSLTESRSMVLASLYRKPTRSP